MQITHINPVGYLDDTVVLTKYAQGEQNSSR